MVCRWSGLCFFSFFFFYFFFILYFGLRLLLLSLPLSLLLSSPPPKTTCALFSFISIIFSSFCRRHISADWSGYVLFIDVLHGAVSFVFSYIRVLPSSPRHRLLLAHDGGGGARTYIYKYTPRIIMYCCCYWCKKKNSQLGRVRSPGIPPPFFSSYHFQQATDQVLCAAAPYMDHNIPSPFWTRRQTTNIIREKREKANGSNVAADAVVGIIRIRWKK